MEAQRRALLLTPWCFPIQIIPWEAAIKMRYEGTADVLVEYSDEVASPSVSWKVPAVLRLRELPQRMKRGIKFSRSNVFQRDGYRCQYCRVKFAANELTYDHVVPKSHGGRRNWTNIVTACQKCNGKKGNRTCDESGMYPMTYPQQPTELPLTSPRIDPNTAPEEWHGFVGVP